MKKFGIIVAGIVVGGLVLLGGCFALLGGAANEVAKDLEKDTTTGQVAAEEIQDATGEGDRYSWKDLEVRKDPTTEWFAGSLTVTNSTDEATEVFVQVTAYDGEQTLGTLDGSARVKPGATTKVPLTSLEEFEKATDYEVEISGF
jgi:hypothetical protein